MKSIRISPTCIISVADETEQEINVDGKIWRFDFDRHLGPCWLKKDGEPRSCQSPNKRVWEEFSKWLEEWHKQQKKHEQRKATTIKIDSGAPDLVQGL